MGKTYSNSSNARRAARAAKLTDGEFTIAEDGKGYKFCVAAPAPAPAPSRKAKTVKAPKAPAKKAAARKAPAPTGETKKAQLVAMVSRGATVAESMKALGWLPHTTRAALSRLDKVYEVQRTRIGAESRYKIAS